MTSPTRLDLLAALSGVTGLALIAVGQLLRRPPHPTRRPAPSADYAGHAAAAREALHTSEEDRDADRA